jgi:hypothetical protein
MAPTNSPSENRFSANERSGDFIILLGGLLQQPEKLPA